MKLYSYVVIFFLLIVSCGYHFVGSESIPFDSITISPVINRTYEPRLEDIMHRALSEAFIEQGIQVVDRGGDYHLSSLIKEFRTITESEFRSNTLDRGVPVEQSVTMYVSFILTDPDNKTKSFNGIDNPYKFNYDASGTVQSAVNLKDSDIRRVCREIALELITQITLAYVP